MECADTPGELRVRAVLRFIAGVEAAASLCGRLGVCAGCLDAWCRTFLFHGTHGLAARGPVSGEEALAQDAYELEQLLTEAQDELRLWEGLRAAAGGG